MVADPAAVFAEVRERLGVPVGEPPQRFEEPLLRRDDGRQRRAIVAAFQPEAVELYEELRRRAGVEASSPEEPLASDAATMSERAIVEWSRAAAAAHQASMAAEARVAAEVAARIADLERAKRAAEGRSWELQGRIDELALQVQRLTLGGAAADARHAA